MNAAAAMASSNVFLLGGILWFSLYDDLKGRMARVVAILADSPGR